MDELHSTDELHLTGHRVISTGDFPRVKMQKRRIDADHTEYAVSGLAPLNHEALAQVLSTPLGIIDANPHEVRKNLSDMSYPSRHMRLLAKRAGIASYLEEHKASFGELASVMNSADTSPVAIASLPVFSYGEARSYVFDRLQEMDLKPLLRNLRRFGLSPQAEAWFELMASTIDTPDGSFDEVFGDASKRHELLKKVVLAAKNDPGDTSIVNFIDHQQDQWFTSFTDRKSYVSDISSESAHDNSIYIRTDDAPTRTGAETTVLVGPELDMLHKKTGLPQRRVSFYNEQQEVFASRRLAWVHNRATDERTAVLQGSTLESVHSRVLRQSAFVGMATAAMKFGQDIDYSAALEAAMAKAGHRFRHLARAGLWPLVATHEQEKIFSAPYFRRVEEKLDY